MCGSILVSCQAQQFYPGGEALNDPWVHQYVRVLAGVAEGMLKFIHTIHARTAPDGAWKLFYFIFPPAVFISALSRTRSWANRMSRFNVPRISWPHP